ncbi:MAG: hypothetical protein JSV25_14835 [Spirochaetota bacterium]|nr:MAG: hypothetical protein JSV25_14835 [Spirochaetota bacterium]
MTKDLRTEIDKVRCQRWTNRANNAKNDIARAFFEFAFTLKQIKDNGYYDYKYDNFKDYSEFELQLDWRTAYDYVKIADFVIDNHNYLTTEKAGLLGHKKLKLLAQKLSKLEKQHRSAILSSIDAH